MREFEMALAELTEACIDANIEFDAYMEGLAIDEEGYYYSESAMCYLTEADLKEMAGGAKAAIGNMVQSFFDFLNGAFVNLCDKLKQRPDLKGLAASLQTKARDAKASVQKYWAEVKAVKGEEKTGKLAGLRTKISTIVERFKKMCKDAGAKISAAAGAAKDAVKGVPGKVKAAPDAVKGAAKSVKNAASSTAAKGAVARGDRALNRGKDDAAFNHYDRSKRY